MTLHLLVKTEKYLTLIVPDVRSYYFGKQYLEVYMNNSSKQHFKLTTILRVKETV